MSNLGVEYPDKDPCSREWHQALLTGKTDYFSGTGDPSIQMERQYPDQSTGQININNRHELKCHNGGPKSDGEWYDPNQAGQQVTAHCVIL